MIAAPATSASAGRSPPKRPSPLDRVEGNAPGGRGGGQPREGEAHQAHAEAGAGARVPHPGERGGGGESSAAGGGGGNRAGREPGGGGNGAGRGERGGRQSEDPRCEFQLFV